MADFDLASLYDPKDNLERFTNRVIPYLTDMFKVDARKLAKEVYYSIPLVQIYKQPPKLSRLSNKISVRRTNTFHECDIFHLPNDNSYRYAFVIVDRASRFKKAVALKNKTAAECARLLSLYTTQLISRNPLYY